METLSRSRESVTIFDAMLTALDPAAVIRRGYAALQRGNDGIPVFSVAQAAPGTRIVALLADGTLNSSVESTTQRSPVVVNQ